MIIVRTSMGNFFQASSFCFVICFSSSFWNSTQAASSRLNIVRHSTVKQEVKVGSRYQIIIWHNINADSEIQREEMKLRCSLSYSSLAPRERQQMGVQDYYLVPSRLWERRRGCYSWTKNNIKASQWRRMMFSLLSFFVTGWVVTVKIPGAGTKGKDEFRVN